MKQATFTKTLLQWNEADNDRPMPWKGETDPYKIWLSEIILQQTQVKQGWGYYERFIANYPTIKQLAAAKDEAVFKLWEGLGYYNRCKNLLITARFISEKLNGKFPDTYDTIVALKGIGPYTAAAIASFAFNLPYAVVDGNVFRVLSRVFGIDTAIDSTKGKQAFTELANKVLDHQQPGIYNQAIMDFGATVCKPFAPLCNVCPLQKTCAAYQKGIVNLLPIKEKVLQKKNRWLYYFLIECNSKVLVHKRTANDIWQSLYEFYILEANEQQQWDETTVTKWFLQQLGITEPMVINISSVQKQQLTHQQIKGQFIKVKLSAIPTILQDYQWINIKQLHTLAFPKFINQYLETPILQGDLF
jgi:A/G-specific adenine glycosylase